MNNLDRQFRVGPVGFDGCCRCVTAQSPQILLVDHPAVEADPLTIACPLCYAQPGAYCLQGRVSKTTREEPHSRRVVAARAQVACDRPDPVRTKACGACGHAFCPDCAITAWEQGRAA